MVADGVLNGNQATDVIPAVVFVIAIVSGEVEVQAVVVGFVRADTPDLNGLYLGNCRYRIVFVLKAFADAVFHRLSRKGIFHSGGQGFRIFARLPIRPQDLYGANHRPIPCLFSPIDIR